jgi:NADH:ubiquinone oxidoreductase subunit
MRLSSLWDRAIGRRMVGKDSHGNQFFLQASSEAGKPARRIVEHPNGTPDSASMDIEWWSWLHGRREELDTPREVLAERVAVINAEDAKNRLRGLSSSKLESTPAQRKRAALMQLATTRDTALSDRPLPSQRGVSQGVQPPSEQNVEPTVSTRLTVFSERCDYLDPNVFCANASFDVWVFLALRALGKHLNRAPGHRSEATYALSSSRDKLPLHAGILFRTT